MKSIVTILPKLLIILLIYVIAGLFLNGNTVEARATGNFPNTSHATQGDPVAAVGIYGSEGGGNSELNAPKSEFEVRVKGPGNADIIIKDACYTGSRAGKPNAKYYSLKVTVPGQPTKDNGEGWMNGLFGDCKTTASATGKWEIGDIVYLDVPVSSVKAFFVEKVNPGIKGFKVKVEPSQTSAAGAPVTVSYDQDSTRANSGKPGGNNGFALFGSGTVEFEFKLPCNFAGGAAYLKWFDADDGTPGIQSSNLSWQITDQNTSATISRQNLGGDNQYAEHLINAGFFKKGHTYVWEWKEVDGVNGVQLWLPFSENTAIHGEDCTPDPPQPPPPPPPPDKNCQRFEHNMAAGSRYRFTIFNDRNVGHTSTPAEGEVVNNGNGWRYKTFNMGPVAQFDRDGGSQFAYDYPNPSRDWIVYIEKWEGFDPAGPDTRDWRYTDGNASPTDIGRSFQLDCYSAEVDPGGNCSIRVTGPTIPGTSNGFPVGSTVTVTATIRNNGKLTLDENINGYRLALNGTDGIHFVGRSINPGDSADVSFQHVVEPVRGNYSVSLYPDYYGNAPLGPGCSTSYDAYQRYSIRVSASSSYDTENPTEVTFITSVAQGPGVDVNGTSTRAFFKQNGTNTTSLGGDEFDSANFGNKTYTDFYTVPDGSTRRGDIYCARITVDRGFGWRGPGEQYINEGPAQGTNCVIPPNCAELGLTNCNPGDPEDPDNPDGCPPQTGCSPTPTPVQDKPYVRFYGNDVSVGGGFAPNCGATVSSPTSSGIFAFIRPIQEHEPDDKSGSGSQLAAMAMGNIRGFVSASLRSDPDPKLPPWSPRGLTFANTIPLLAAEDVVDPVLGGGMPAANSNCAPNYFEETQFPDDDIRKKSIASTTTLAGLVSEEQSLRTGNFEINPAGFLFENRHTIYVEGNVTIRSDVKYNPSYGPRIPNFTLVVRGNIYIDKSVNQLDGLYIAQPNNAPATPVTGGRIYTCTTGGVVPTTSTELYACGADANAADSCGETQAIRARQLVVNGAFIAERVVLNRTVYSLRCSFFKEDSSTAYGPRASKASEIFRFSPEMYLSPSVFSPRATSTSGEYDYITTLPPTL